jgi:hypothetical protein
MKGTVQGPSAAEFYIAVLVRSTSQSRPRFPAYDPIDFQAIGSLEGHHGGLCAATENAIDS